MCVSYTYSFRLAGELLSLLLVSGCRLGLAEAILCTARNDAPCTPSVVILLNLDLCLSHFNEVRVILRS